MRNSRFLRITKHCYSPSDHVSWESSTVEVLCISLAQSSKMVTTTKEIRVIQQYARTCSWIGVINSDWDDKAGRYLLESSSRHLKGRILSYVAVALIWLAAFLDLLRLHSIFLSKSEYAIHFLLQLVYTFI